MNRLLVGVMGIVAAGVVGLGAVGLAAKPPAGGEGQLAAKSDPPAKKEGKRPASRAASSKGKQTGDKSMRLGNFSVSLAVKDLAASKAFYEKLGLRVVAGDAAKNYLIMQNETSTIGLFQGMFEKNILTFNPGWDRTCATLPDFDDVRDIQRTLKGLGLKPDPAADESTTGPAAFMVIDPDGNPILVDQHVPRPGK